MAALVYCPPGANVIYDGKGPISEFLERYLSYAMAYSWNDDTTLSQLQFYLDGAHRKAYKLQMKQKSSTTLKDMVKYLKKRFATKFTPEKYCRNGFDIPMLCY